MFRLRRTFHPTLLVPDRDEAERFFKRVFGRSVIRMEDRARFQGGIDGYPTNYAMMIKLAEVMVDALDVNRFEIDGAKPYIDRPVPVLENTGWGVDGIEEVYRHLVHHGIRSTDVRMVAGSADDAPTTTFNDMRLFFTVAEDTGIQLEFIPWEELAEWRMPPEWEQVPALSQDPLGLVRLAHHTILTSNPARIERVLIDVLGGERIGKGVDGTWGGECRYIWLVDAIYQITVPGADGQAARDRCVAAAPADAYVGMTFVVDDLARAEAHLAACDIAIARRTDDTLVTDPLTTLGVAWGFTTALLPGDPRILVGSSS